MSLKQNVKTLLKTNGRPAFLYGTAWKKEETTRLVQEAIEAGFTAVDTAAQPKHYREDLVGEALRNAYEGGVTTRDRLFIQTKFTSPGGQDLNNMPYDPSSPLQTQLTASLNSSFHNLRPSADPSSASQTYIDCLLLHSPLRTIEETLSAWQSLETYVPNRIKHLGISNVTLPILQAVYQAATIKPAVVQNRFYPATRHDGPLRRFCAEKGIVYESFWTLTGNRELVKCQPVTKLAQQVGVSVPVALYSMAMGLGVAVLNGTTNKERMKEDLEGVVKVQDWAAQNPAAWKGLMGGFAGLVGGGRLED